MNLFLKYVHFYTLQGEDSFKFQTFFLVLQDKFLGSYMQKNLQSGSDVTKLFRTCDPK